MWIVGKQSVLCRCYIKMVVVSQNNSTVYVFITEVEWWSSEKDEDDSVEPAADSLISTTSEVCLIIKITSLLSVTALVKWPWTVCEQFTDMKWRSSRDASSIQILFCFFLFVILNYLNKASPCITTYPTKHNNIDICMKQSV